MGRNIVRTGDQVCTQPFGWEGEECTSDDPLSYLGMGLPIYALNHYVNNTYVHLVKCIVPCYWAYYQSIGWGIGANFLNFTGYRIEQNELDLQVKSRLADIQVICAKKKKKVHEIYTVHLHWFWWCILGRLYLIKGPSFETQVPHSNKNSLGVFGHCAACVSLVSNCTCFLRLQ